MSEGRHVRTNAQEPLDEDAHRSWEMALESATEEETCYGSTWDPASFYSMAPPSHSVANMLSSSPPRP